MLFCLVFCHWCGTSTLLHTFLLCWGFLLCVSLVWYHHPSLHLLMLRFSVCCVTGVVSPPFFTPCYVEVFYLLCHWCGITTLLYTLCWGFLSIVCVIGVVPPPFCTSSCYVEVLCLLCHWCGITTLLYTFLLCWGFLSIVSLVWYHYPSLHLLMLRFSVYCVIDVVSPPFFTPSCYVEVFCLMCHWCGITTLLSPSYVEVFYCVIGVVSPPFFTPSCYVEVFYCVIGVVSSPFFTPSCYVEVFCLMCHWCGITTLLSPSYVEVFYCVIGVVSPPLCTPSCYVEVFCLLSIWCSITTLLCTLLCWGFLSVFRIWCRMTITVS